MVEILIAALSPVGHIGPMITIADDLVSRGDHVTVLTSAEHVDAIEAVGASPHVITREADFDESRFDAATRAATSGLTAMNAAITRLFLWPMPHQVKELAKAMAHRRFDAIIADCGFFGVLPMLLDDAANRPAVLVYTPTPLMLSSRDTAPSGLGLAPASGPLGRLRNRTLNLISHKVMLLESQRAANYLLERVGAPRLPVFVLDSGVLADRYIVPTVREFEYPRSDLPANVRFVGAVHPLPDRSFRPPSWWRELDGDRPVVHVTQGTVDNGDLSRLIEPTLEALRDEDVTVVVTTGRDAPEFRFPLPDNARVADYLPHDRLLPKVDVFVTNGGYGAVQRAVCAGVPMVVAGSTEDKPEVAARVQWSGAGINLHTGTPNPAQIRTAVRTVLSDRRYLRRVRELESAFAQRDGVAEIGVLIDEVLQERNKSVSK